MKKWVVLSLMVIGLLAMSPISGGYEVGDTVSDFKLKNVDGKMISLSDYKQAKGFIIIFDCNTCPMSRAYTSRIVALNKKYVSQGFPVVLINPNSAEVVADESFDEMKKHAKDHGYDFPYLYDECTRGGQFNPTIREIVSMILGMFFHFIKRFIGHNFSRVWIIKTTGNPCETYFLFNATIREVYALDIGHVLQSK